MFNNYWINFLKPEIISAPDRWVYLIKDSVMKEFSKAAAIFSLVCIFLMIANVHANAHLPTFKIKKYGTDPSSCEVIEFEDLSKTEINKGYITTVYSESTPVKISAQQRLSNGRLQTLNSAVLFDTSKPKGKSLLFGTPNSAAPRPMGYVLTSGKQSEHTTFINNTGSIIELDFSAMGSITLKGIHVLDITDDEAQSRLEMVNAAGEIIKTIKLPVTGAYGAIRLDTENTPGVVKLRVIFESTINKKGSGAVDVIEFCRKS